VDKLGPIPNSGLLLPAVGGEGKWVAYLTVSADSAVEQRALLTGRGLKGAALAMRATVAGAAPRTICPSGAAWPAWSADGKLLAYVAAGAGGQAVLAVHDVAAGTTRRIGVGVAWMFMPSFSPDARRVAVVVPGELPNQSRVHVVDLETAKLTPAPQGADEQWQIAPAWRDRRRVAFVRSVGQVVELAQWEVGSPTVRSAAPLAVSAAMSDAFQSFAGLPASMAPGGRGFAYYRAMDDRVAIAPLPGGQGRSMPDGTRAGCWLGAEHFLSATDADLLLTAVGSGESKRLIDGRWLPLWGNWRRREAIVCTATSDPWTFGLVRLRLLAE